MTDVMLGDIPQRHGVAEDKNLLDVNAWLCGNGR